eukprot:scaffold7297_cov125-Isochrysis_galbana.AAC.6
MRDRSQAERPAVAMAKCARTSTRSTGQTAGAFTEPLAGVADDGYRMKKRAQTAHLGDTAHFGPEVL